MAEFVYNPVQTILPGGDAIVNLSIGCNKGNILFRPETSQITLRGNVNNPCAKFARYQVTANGNIAVPTGGTAGPIAVALAIGTSTIPTSRAIVTPAAVEEYNNVTSTAIIDIPTGCCINVALRNVSESADPATTPAPTIELQNLNIVINRIA